MLKLTCEVCLKIYKHLNFQFFLVFFFRKLYKINTFVIVKNNNKKLKLHESSKNNFYKFSSHIDFRFINSVTKY